MRLVGAILIGAVLAGATCGGAQAQSWPNRPVKIIVPLAPGGAADILGRIIAEHLSTALKQSVVVENRASGGGSSAQPPVRPPNPTDILWSSPASPPM
jgi:tripartite-type tricarboxylate transporter receptor subunit TctC